MCPALETGHRRLVCGNSCCGSVRPTKRFLPARSVSTAFSSKSPTGRGCAWGTDLFRPQSRAGTLSDTSWELGCSLSNVWLAASSDAGAQEQSEMLLVCSHRSPGPPCHLHSRPTSELCLLWSLPAPSSTTVREGSVLSVPVKWREDLGKMSWRPSQRVGETGRIQDLSSFQVETKLKRQRTAPEANTLRGILPKYDFSL